MKKSFLCLLCILLFFGCEKIKNDFISKEDAGFLLNIKEIATSFNDSQRTRIETTKGIFHVTGIVSGLKNKSVYIKHHTRRSYLCIEGNDSCYTIRR